MAKTHILVDTLNLFFRAKHVAHGSDIDTKIGMAMHIMFNSVRKSWREFNGDHVVFCLEGRSWRKDFYKPYKLNRKVKQLERTPREVEEDELFFEGLSNMCEFLDQKTNSSVLQCPVAEADDLIAFWIQAHPEDNHIIISSDSDYYQCLAHNVKIYNGVTEQTITLDGFYDAKGKLIIDKKTKLPKVKPDPEWLLFEKCVRGDTSDNIFSAAPGARTKGTKNKVGILEAFADRNSQGYNYNNFMLQKWVDTNGVEQRVKDCYERNKRLIDLTAQPDEIKQACATVIVEGTQKERIPGVGIHFLKFCATWDLQNLAKYPDDFAKILNAKYQ